MCNLACKESTIRVNIRQCNNYIISCALFIYRGNSYILNFTGNNGQVSQQTNVSVRTPVSDLSDSEHPLYSYAPICRTKERELTACHCLWDGKRNASLACHQTRRCHYTNKQEASSSQHPHKSSPEDSWVDKRTMSQ